MHEPSLDMIHEILFGASKALVLKMAIELDVFTEISHGNRSANAIANATTCHTEGMRSLLDALVPLGFLQKQNGEYVLTPTSSAFLVRDRPSFYGDSYLDALLPWAWRDGAEAVTALRTDRGPAKVITDSDAVTLWRPWCEAHTVVRDRILAEADDMWERIKQRIALPDSPRVLDVACGHALSTLALAQQDGGAEITGLDRYDEVLAIAHRLSKELGLEHRFETMHGDIRNFDIRGRTFDIVYIGGILYLFSEDEVREILHRVAAVVNPNGLLIINTMIVDEERCSATGPLIQSFRRFLYNGGRVPSFREYEQAVEAAGFGGTSQIGDNIVIARCLGA